MRRGLLAACCCCAAQVLALRPRSMPTLAVEGRRAALRSMAALALGAAGPALAAERPFNPLGLTGAAPTAMRARKRARA